MPWPWNGEAMTAWRGPARDTFNVVITDLRLPGLNGLELVRQLHAAQPRLPIILITAFGTDRDRHRGDEVRRLRLRA